MTLVIQVLNIDKVDIAILTLSFLARRYESTKHFLSKECVSDLQIVVVLISVITVVFSAIRQAAVSHPRMIKHIWNGDALTRFNNEHFFNQIFNFIGNRVNREVEISLQD